MKNEDLLLLVGLLLQKLGGKVEITKEEQLEFTKGLAAKEILTMEDPKTNSFHIKLVEKEKQTN